MTREKLQIVTGVKLMTAATHLEMAARAASLGVRTRLVMHLNEAKKIVREVEDEDVGE